MSPDISIAIEWENCILAEMERSFHMLENLGEQICSLSRAVEVIVLYDPEEVEEIPDQDDIAGLLNSTYENTSFYLRIERSCNKKYYELKNEGARLANGEILIFLDSDVIPEDGWLKGMVEPFYDNPDIKVLAGSTYLDYKDLYSKAFALGWIYSPRVTEKNLHDHNKFFWAHNVAFKREIFMNYMFPKMPDGVSRGSCAELAKQLSNDGIKVWTNTGSRVSHPAPNGFSHFYKKAMAQGRDNWLKIKSRNSGFWRFFIGYYLTNLKYVMINNLRKYRVVSLPIWQIPLTLLIMVSYHTLSLSSGIITLIMTEYAKSSWKV